MIMAKAAKDGTGADEMKQYMEYYISEVEDHLEKLNTALLEFEHDFSDMEAINQIFRSSHTLKSSSAAMGFKKFSGLAHKMEDVLGRIRDRTIKVDENVIDVLFRCIDAMEALFNQVKDGGKENLNTAPLIKNLNDIYSMKSVSSGPSKRGMELADRPDTIKPVDTIKVHISRLDSMVNLIGEMLINNARIINIAERLGSVDLEQSINHLRRLTSDIQYEIMKARMVPVNHIFNQFPRIVRDIAKREGKEIDFVMEGGEMELDRTIVDGLGEPLIHMLRNSVDHGIEPPGERGKKPKRGRIKLIAKKVRNTAVIELFDDGKGFDPAVIKATAIRKRIATESQLSLMKEDDLLKLVFHPNFSTAKKVTDISGRGVGMNVVKSKIESMNGSVKFDTKAGEYSRIILELPLTLAIIHCFLVEDTNKIYAIPLNNIVRTISIKREDIKTIEGHEVIIFEGIEIPLLRMEGILGTGEYERKGGVVVVVERGKDKAGIAIEKIIGEQELIIKSLDASLKQTKGVSGATILGDGMPALILDINTLF